MGMFYGHNQVKESPSSGLGYGLLYNWYAVSHANFAPTGWHVPTWAEINTLVTYIGGFDEGGGKLKETGTTHWTDPNVATNTVNFNLRGSGYRTNAGTFIELGLSCILGLSNLETTCLRIINNGTDAIYITYAANVGHSARVVRTATPAEQLLADGTACAPYTGNDGKNYRTVKIGTQVWLADNLAETKFRNGDWIPGFDNGVYTPISNAAWAALTTGALCAYNNDWNYV